MASTTTNIKESSSSSAASSSSSPTISISTTKTTIKEKDFTFIQPLLDRMEQENVGFSCSNFRCSSACKPCTGKETQLVDRFSVSATYCHKHSLQFDVIFNANAPGCAPDFLFPSCLTQLLATSNGKAQNALYGDWPTSSKTLPVDRAVGCLLKVRDVFAALQGQTIITCKHPSVVQEYEMVSQMPGVECFVDDKALHQPAGRIYATPKETTEISILVPIDDFSFDVSTFVNSAQQDLKKNEKAKLLVSYKPAIVPKISPTTQIILPQSWRPFFPSSLHHPSWSSEELLVTYLPKVVERLQKEKTRIFARRELVCAFVERFGHPLEVDNFGFKHVAFACDLGGSVFLIRGNLSSFPKRSPALYFESISYFSKANKSAYSTPLTLKIDKGSPPEAYVNAMYKAIKDPNSRTLQDFRRFAIEKAIS